MNNRFTRTITRQQKLLLILVILPLYLLCGSLIATAIVQFLIQSNIITNDYYTVLGVLNLIVDIILIITAILMYNKQLSDQFRHFKINLKSNLIAGLIKGPLLLLLMSVIGGLVTIAAGGADISANQSAIESLVYTVPVLISIPTIFLAPVFEEIIFRGLIFTWIYSKSPKTAHFVSAFIFGFIHVMSALSEGNISEMIQIIPYFLMGLVLSHLFEKHNNIYVPIIAHSANNFFGVITQFM